jgi:hypothetical protein
MRSLIASDVSHIDSTYSLPVESIFGSGGQPRGTVSPRVAGRAKALKKCKRIHNRKKRRRCVKRVKSRARGAA